MPPRDRLSDPLEARFPHCLCQWRVITDPIPPSPRSPPHYNSRNPVTEDIQGPLHPRGEYPRLCPKPQHRLRRCFIKKSRNFRICPPPRSVSKITTPNSFVPSQGCLPPQASHCLPLSTPIPGIETPVHSPEAPRMTRRPSPSYP